MEPSTPLWLWTAFFLIVVFALILDFFLLKQNDNGSVSFQQALDWSIFWILISVVFNGLYWIYIYTDFNTEIANAKSLEFLTGYLIEKSLAVDNVFIFLMIFTYFRVPIKFQKRVLLIGVILAIVLRAIMIFLGVWLVKEFSWILYVFGAFLVITGIKMWFAAGKEDPFEENPLLKILKKIIKVSKGFDGEKFLTIQNGKRVATPLLMVVSLVALTDIIFAVDSIPAIFAITLDPFIVLTSNVFAILGLRAMFFMLQAAATKFHLITYGLAIILVWVGTKMLLVDIIKIPVFISLAVIIIILTLTVYLSNKFPEKK